MDPGRAPREASLSAAFTGQPTAGCPASGQRSGDKLSQRRGPPRRVNAEERPVSPAATQGNSGEAPCRDRVSPAGE